MKISTKKSIAGAPTRRRFLSGSVVAATYLAAVGVREPIAKADKVAKPLLTPEAFTEHLADAEKRKLIKLDLVQFVDTHFDLTPGQLQNFKKVPKGDLENFVDAIEKAEKLKVKIVLRTTMTKTSCHDGLGFRMKTSFDSNGLTILSYRE